MILYFATPFVAIVSYFLFSKTQLKINGKNNTRNAFLFISFLIPLIIFAFRSTAIGRDTYIYCVEFERIAEFSFKELLVVGYGDYEKGFLFFCRIISLFSKDFRLFLLVSSLIINLIYAKLIAEDKSVWLVSVLIYFFLGNYLYNLNILRQAIAAGITINSFKYLCEKKYLNYIVLSVIAFSFHSFAIVSLFFLLATFLIRTKKQLYIYLIVTAVFIIKSLELVHLVVKLFFPHFDYYFRNNYHSNQRLGVTSWGYVLIESLILFLILKNYSFTKDNKAKIVTLSFSLTIAICALIMMPSFGIYERIAKYFQPSLIVAVPYALRAVKNVRKKMIFIGVLLLYSFAFYCYILINNAYSIVPYKTWFGK